MPAITYRIAADKCTGCTACEPVCPVAYIYDRGNTKRIINEEACTSFSLCSQEYPVDCIPEI